MGRRVRGGGETGGRMGATLYEALATDAPVGVPEKVTLNSVRSTSQLVAQTGMDKDGYHTGRRT